MYAQMCATLSRMESNRGGPALAALIKASIGDEALQSFAARAGISPSQFSRWANGAHSPDLDSVRKVADTLGIPRVQMLVLAGILDEDDVDVDLPQAAPRQIRAEDAVLLDATLPPEGREHLLRSIELVRGSQRRRRGPRKGLKARPAVDR